MDVLEFIPICHPDDANQGRIVRFLPSTGFTGDICNKTNGSRERSSGEGRAALNLTYRAWLRAKSSSRLRQRPPSKCAIIIPGQ